MFDLKEELASAAFDVENLDTDASAVFAVAINNQAKALNLSNIEVVGALSALIVVRSSVDYGIAAPLFGTVALEDSLSAVIKKTADGTGLENNLLTASLKRIAANFDAEVDLEETPA